MGKTTRKAGASGGAASSAPAQQRITKLDSVIALLQRPDGASITEMMSATGWQQHSVRGVLAGALKKKGHVVVSAVTDGERRYSIALS